MKQKEMGSRTTLWAVLRSQFHQAPPLHQLTCQQLFHQAAEEGERCATEPVN